MITYVHIKSNLNFVRKIAKERITNNNFEHKHSELFIFYVTHKAIGLLNLKYMRIINFS